MSARGNASEREAQRISERALLASQPGVQVRQASPSAVGGAIAPPIVHEALASPGRPRDQAVRAAIAPSLGHDFARVRIHTDEIAARSARALNARAYTVGRDVVFARGQFAPGTAHGRRLLAHELAHVVQQDGSPGAGVVQRAEVDDRSCAGLMDIEPDIDTHVNKEIVDERTAMDKPIFTPLLVLHVMQRLGGRSPISPIETFIEALPASKRTLPPSSLAGTKFSGVENVNQFYRLQTLGAAHVVGSVVKIHGICVGADKLGHFFDQGWDYLEQASKPGSKTSDIDNLGRVMETGVFGLASTGVFSNADIAANRAGLQFYKDLKRNPSRFTFRIRDYISKQWNEQTNPSFYESAVAGVIWSNLLTGNWQGTFTSAANRRAVGTTFTLSATAAGSVTGTFQLALTVGAGLPADITIKNGKITQRTTGIPTTPPSGAPVTFTPVSGISIDFDWERAADKGKGKLDSVDEQTLAGTLGTGSSVTGSGTLKLRKT